MRTNRNRIVIVRDVVYRYPVLVQDQRSILIHAENQRMAARAGLPVPEVLDVAEDGPEPHIVMRRAAGTPLMETTLGDAASAVLAERLAEFLTALWGVEDWAPPAVPWPELWDALDRAVGEPQTSRAALIAACAPVRPSHGDLSPGNLMVETDGRLNAVLDWDAATRSDPATDFSALCANTPPKVAEQLRRIVPESSDLDARAQAYLDTWPAQNRLWQADAHPWLVGDEPVSHPRV